MSTETSGALGEVRVALFEERPEALLRVGDHRRVRHRVDRHRAVPLCRRGAEAGFEGVVDLVGMRELRWDPADQGVTVTASPIAPQRLEAARAARERLLDALASLSDELTGLYVAGAGIPADLVRKVLRQAVLQRAFTPVFCGASLRNVGVQPLLDAVVDLLPSPVDVPPVTGHHVKKEDAVEVPCRPEAFALGLVFKLQATREAGNLCYVRMYSGRIKEGQVVYNVGRRKRERVHRLLRMHANQQVQIDHVGAGDIAVIIGMKQARTGDTIGVEAFPILLERMHFPVPVISVAIEPRSRADQGARTSRVAHNTIDQPRTEFRPHKPWSDTPHGRTVVR